MLQILALLIFYSLVVSSKAIANPTQSLLQHLFTGILNGEKPPHHTSNERSIDGQPDIRPVVAILGERLGDYEDSPNKKVLCSGTILEGDCVLTARHCVENHDQNSFEVVLGPSKEGNHRYQVVKQKFQRGTTHRKAEYDLAVLKLKTPVPAEYSWSIDQIPKEPINLKWRKAFIAGYGATAAQNKDKQWIFENSGEKHLGEVAVPTEERNVMTVIPFQIEKKQLALSGDSGGPLLLAGENGTPPQIIGVAGQLKPVEHNLYVSTQKHRDNIIALMKNVGCGPYRQSP